MPPPTPKPQFMLLLHQPNTGPAPEADEMKEIMGRFAVWMNGLRQEGRVLATNGLQPTGSILRGKRGTFRTDGPFVEAKEIVGGYVLITADSHEHAVETACACPGLDYRMSVEVRPVIMQRLESER